MPRLKVLITGAGIGGNALGFWLSKLNHDVTIVERHPCLRVNGLQLDLRGDGIKVMKRMNLEKAVRSKLVPEEAIALVDSTGRRRALFRANKTGKGGQSMTSEYEIMRYDLCTILHDATAEQGAKYIFGTYVQNFEERDGIVQVELANGQKESFDLVVGADGLGSRLRRMMVSEPSGEKKDSFVELNERMAYFTIPKPIALGEQYLGTMYMMQGKRFVLTRRHNADTLQVYLWCSTNFGLNQPATKAQRGNIQTEKDAFAEVFRDSGWKTNELMKAMQDGAEDWYCQYTGFVTIKGWSKGHVTLAGDAAHGAPADGMGTSAALIGAYVLAGEIARYCGTGDDTAKINKSEEDQILKAIAAYEKRYQPYIAQTHKSLSAEPKIFDKIPWNQVTLEIFFYTAWIVSLLRLDQMIGRLFPMEDVKGWSLPQYEM